jgi:hypothetical protein
VILCYNKAMSTQENVYLSCRIPPKLHRQIDAYAQHHGLNRTSAVIVLLNQGVENAKLPGGALQLGVENAKLPGGALQLSIDLPREHP